MKLLATIILLQALLLQASLAGIINAVSPNFSDVSAAVASAGRGDTVKVPAGSGAANWGDNTLVVTKGIWLNGPGRGSLTITGHTASDYTLPANQRHVFKGLIQIEPDARAITDNEIIRITGFTFDGSLLPGTTSDHCIGGAGGSVSSPFRKLAIGDCKFFMVRNSTRVFTFGGQMRGVVYNNDIDRCNIIFSSFGIDSTSEWISTVSYPFAYGSVDNLYFENNHVRWSVPAGPGSDPFSAPGWHESGQGGRAVIRYNTYDFANAKDYLGNTANLEIWDIHGFQGWDATNPTHLAETGTMVEEIYGNTVLNYNGGPAVILRGSWGLVHNNSITGPVAGTAAIQAREYGTGANGGSGCADQITPSAVGVYRPEINNSYCFNNTLNGNQHNMINGSLGNGCGVTENSNFYNYTSSFNGSVGIGRGTSAPSISATDGTAYWQNGTATPSVDPNIIQNGHLWKRVGGTWVDYYRPYTFPHPLTVVGTTPTPTPTPTPAAPAAPINFRRVP